MRKIISFLDRIIFSILPPKAALKLWHVLWDVYRYAGNTNERRTLMRRVFGFFIPKKDVLVYVGANHGDSLWYMFRDYKRCYVFEPIPEIFEKLEARYHNFPHVKCYNAAVSNKEETANFYVAKDTVFSSLGHNRAEEAATKYYQKDRVIQVSCIHLGNFLTKEEVSYIDSYVSDAEGMDYAILESLKDWIDKRNIGTIQAEVNTAIDNHFQGLPSNHAAKFEELLAPHYELIARARFYIVDGIIRPVAKKAIHMDFKWKVRSAV